MTLNTRCHNAGMTKTIDIGKLMHGIAFHFNTSPNVSDNTTSNTRQHRKMVHTKPPAICAHSAIVPIDLRVSLPPMFWAAWKASLFHTHFHSRLCMLKDYNKPPSFLAHASIHGILSTGNVTHLNFIGNIIAWSVPISNRSRILNCWNVQILKGSDEIYIT